MRSDFHRKRVHIDLTPHDDDDEDERQRRERIKRDKEKKLRKEADARIAESTRAAEEAMREEVTGAERRAQADLSLIHIRRCRRRG